MFKIILSKLTCLFSSSEETWVKFLYIHSKPSFAAPKLASGLLQLLYNQGEKKEEENYY